MATNKHGPDTRLEYPPSAAGSPSTRTFERSSHDFRVKVVYSRIFYRLRFRKMIITSGKLKAVSSPPFWEGCWETGGPADGMEEELGGLTTGCPSPLPLGCGCPAWVRRCNSCVSLSLWWSVAVLAAIGLLGVGSTVTKIMSIHNFNIHLMTKLMPYNREKEN